MSDNFAATKYPTARVPHKCHECGRTIGRRERYAKTAGLWEGDFFTNIACLHCAIARMIVDHHDDYYSEGYLMPLPVSPPVLGTYLAASIAEARGPFTEATS